MGATLNLQVAASADDSTETSNGSMQGGIIYAFHLAGYTNGIRLQLNIPKNATILSAYLSGYIDIYDSPNFRIYGESTDSAAAYPAIYYTISSRTKTENYVVWSGTNIGTGWKDSPDIAAVIQEVVNRSGWVSGNYIGFVFSNAASGEGAYIRTYNYTGNSYGMKLAVEYSESAAANRPLIHGGLMARPPQFGGLLMR